MSDQADTTTPLTGAQYEIAAGPYRATVTELGAGLRSLLLDGRPLITGYAADELPPAGAGQLLTPWPNRIDGGRYDFDGASYQLELSEAARGNAIHGLTRWANWEPAGQSAADITLRLVLHGRPGYPFCLRLSARYVVDATSGLTVTVTAANAGTRPAPYGTGSHPYLTCGEPLVDDCELQVPASRWLPTDDRGLPSGPARDVAGSPYDFRAARAIGGTQLDHALTDLARDGTGRARVTLAGRDIRLGLWAGPGYDWLQVFTGDALGPAQRRRALAVEPMTCPPNAFASGDDRITLDPGGSVMHHWGIEVLHP
ncbi:MAG TPA: aldose 1-epimerase family protein [Streptosporangiaceae bacterium]|nr:aldose 1-epimerase family protein [Streptosporangiaceae bacterium]